MEVTTAEQALELFLANQSFYSSSQNLRAIKDSDEDWEIIDEEFEPVGKVSFEGEVTVY